MSEAMAWMRDRLDPKERHYFDEYKALWDLRRLSEVEFACDMQRWEHAFAPCEALACRDPGQVRT